MLVDLTRDNLFVSLAAQKLRVDKTGYLEIIKKAIDTENRPFFVVSAPSGLGVSTFLDMVGAFFDYETPERLFIGTEVLKNSDLSSLYASCLVYIIDFAEVNVTTPCNNVVMKMTEELGFAASERLDANLPKDDFIRIIQKSAQLSGKQVVLILKNFDRVQRYAIKSHSELESWTRLWASLSQQNSKSKFLRLVLASSHISGITDVMCMSGIKEPIFYNLTALNSPYADDLYGWCGLTQEEIHTVLEASFSNLNVDELYDWCGRYDQGLARPASVFASIQAKDLYMTVSLGNVIWYIRKTLEDGFGYYLLCGDIGVGRLLSGETVSMHELNIYDPRMHNNHSQEIYRFTRRFLEIIYGEGLITLNKQSGSSFDNAELVNTETSLAAADAVSEQDDYLAAITEVAGMRDDIQHGFGKSDAKTFADAVLKVLKAQKKFLGSKSNISVWQIANDLLQDMPKYSCESLKDQFIIRQVCGEEGCIVLALSVNHNLSDLLDRTVNLRVENPSFRQLIKGVRGRIVALVVNFKLSENVNEELSAESDMAYVI